MLSLLLTSFKNLHLKNSKVTECEAVKPGASMVIEGF